MALKFGPQWLRDLSDGGTGTTQPHSPTVGTKFKLAEYRYGREEMLSLWNINSPPPDQVRKHLSIFSKENQKPITMMPLTEDEQRLISQGFNSTGVLRAAGRGSAPPLRVPRGGGTADRGRGRGRGRGEGYVPRMENGDVGYHRSQEGWEQVGRKLERSYSRGYEEGSTGNKREFSRSASDNNWREKRQDDEEEDDGGWRAPQSRDANSRWGPSSRRDWRDPRDLSGFEGDRRPPLHHRRGFDQDLRGPRRISESHDNEGEVPEWVEDDIGDDPGTFDSSGAFVSTKDGRRHPDSRYEGGSSGDSEWRRKGPGGGTSSQNNHSVQEKCDQISTSSGDKNQRKYVPPNARNGSGHNGRTDEIIDANQRENEDPPAAASLSKGDLPIDDTLSSKEPERSNTDDIDDIEADFDFGYDDFVEDTGDVTSLYGQGHRLPHTVTLPSKTDKDQQKSSSPMLATSLEASPGVDFLSSSMGSAFQQPSSAMQSSKIDVADLETHLASSSNRNRTSVDPAFAHVEKSLQNLVAQMTLDTEKDGRPRDVSREALPLTHEHANKWFYKDPQGEIQGPFTNEEMAQWFGAGYFTMSLVVKRGCDDSFKQLGELIKRYGRVPFLPGTPLPPLISTGPAPTGESIPSSASATNQTSLANQSLSTASTTNSNILQSLPSVSSSLANTPVAPPMMNPMPDPLMQQMMMLQQEYIKQTFLMRQLQVQTLQQLHQEQENFASLPPDQQQHLAMQMIMGAHPLLLQQLQHIQQQQLLLQQQLQQQQLASQTSVSLGEETVPKSGPLQTHPVISNTQVQASTAPSTSFPSSSAVTSSIDDNLTVWGNMLQLQEQQQPTPSVWSHVTLQQQAQSQAQPQPASLWDVDSSSETLSPAYKAQMEKLKRAREEERLREEERQRQIELERKQEELRRQQEELEQQREQVLREKEELERQKQIDLQKREEARRKEEEARRLEDEKLQREIEKQQREQREAEKRLQEEEKRRQEEERKREKELKKLEEKRRKEEEKRRLQEEQKRQEETRRKQQEEEEARLLQLQVEQEQQRLQAEYEQLQQQREEEEKVQREAAEKERAEMQRRQQQQLELQRQNESLRRLQQAQREQLANMQLPAHSNWADQQGTQGGGPSQSRSLTEIQEEEARREQERLQRQQQEMQKMHEQAFIMNQQHHQKSWATHAAQGLSSRGPSLLDIQQQEQENMKKNQKDKPKVATYQSKIMQGASSSIWSAGPPSITNSSGGVWDAAGGVGSIWGSQPATTTQPARGRQQQAKESGEFPALKNPVQLNKKAAAVKANSNKAGKTAGSKQKKEEETVQKLFQTRQQDDFTQWVTDRVSRFSAQIDVPTFVSFIVEVDSPDDVRDYMVSYLGDNKEARDFARQFVEKRNRSRNQARLEKQQEEDSIWGPAPAINPHIQSRSAASNSGSGDAGEANGSSAGKGGKNRKKKQKMQKLDGSILGFTVHSDPNRKNAAGELEGVQ